MHQRSHGVPLLLVATCTLSACVSVDPSSDYEEVGRYIATVTGHESSYRPGDEELVTARVGSLLSGGLTGPEAVEVALLHNRELQAAFFRIGVARADVVQASSSRRVTG